MVRYICTIYFSDWNKYRELWFSKIIRYFNHENYDTAWAIINVAIFDVYLSSNSSELNSNDTSERMLYAIVGL